MLLAWRPSDDASAIASCASKLIALTSQIVFTMNSAPKTMAGIQKTKIPFQAKGPDLKNGKMIAGVNMIATQMLKYAIHLGKSGVGRGSERIAKANAKYCAMNGGHGITRMIQLISLSHSVASGDRSGRNAVTANSSAGSRNVTQPNAPAAS